jgi:hypothetical protein
MSPVCSKIGWITLFVVVPSPPRIFKKAMKGGAGQAPGFDKKTKFHFKETMCLHRTSCA